MKLIKQFDETDCGAACLAMVADYYGSFASITKIRDAAGTDRFGTSLKGILLAAKKLHMDAKAVKGSEKTLVPDFPVPFIAHVVFAEGVNHFVIVRKITKKKVFIADPGAGFVSYTVSDFLKIWSGYLILISPTPEFEIHKEHSKNLLQFLPLIRPHAKLLTMMVFVSMLISVFGIFSGLYFKFFIDDVIGAKAETSLHVLSLGLVFLTLFTNILTIIRSQFLRLFTLKTTISLSMSYVRHVLSLPLKFFDSRKVGEILSRFDDSEKIRTVLTNIALSTILDFIMMIFVGIYLCITNASLFLILLITVPLSSVIVWISAKYFGKNYREQMSQNADIQSFLVEMLSGIPVIKSTISEENSIESYERKLVNYIDLGQKAWNYGNVKEFITDFITGLGGNLIFWIGGYLILKDKLTLGQLISFNALAAYFTGPLQRFISIQPQIQEASVAADRIGEILEIEPEVQSHTELYNSGRLGETIDCKNIVFRYGTHKPVLIDLSFSSNGRYHIAFVGASGSGKSTLIKLILKFYEPESGEILLGGHNIHDIDTTFLRSRVGYIPQEVYLFSGTVFENITMGKKNYSLDEVMKAAQMAQADQFINDLPDRYYTIISERGSSLSGGERQRIALARALLMNPEILILDEATSALDTISERAFQNVVRSLGDNHILTVTIAHRLSTVVNSDIIFVMDKGTIVEHGSHAELLAKGGLYKKMWEE